MRLWPGKAGGDESTGRITEGAQTTTRIAPHGFCALQNRRAVLENFPIHLSQQTGSLPGFLDGGYLPAQSVVLIDQGHALNTPGDRLPALLWTMPPTRQPIAVQRQCSIALKQSNGHGNRTVPSELGRSSLR